MFFGAGNLIFPPFLAYEAGSSFIPAFLGFAVSAVGLPVLALLAIGKSGSLEKLGNRVHPLFSTIFIMAIYLAIGPCLAIPRTASTSAEMILPDNRLFMLIYSVVFFLAASLVALHPERLSKILGRILSPLLITLIIILFIASVTSMESITSVPLGEYSSSPFAEGLISGYQTMDATAGLVYGIIIFMNLEAMGAEKNRMMKESAISSIGGGLLLLGIYMIIAMIGIRARNLSSELTNGAAILTAMTHKVFGEYGKAILSAIFVLACFNTSVSLLSSCGAYFESLFPKVRRTGWIFIFAAVSCLISNAGLDAIISISEPVLTLLYPVAITLIAITFMKTSDKLKYTYRIAVFITLIFSLLQMMPIGNSIPLASKGFAWLIPAMIGGIIGYIVDERTLSEERAS